MRLRDIYNNVRARGLRDVFNPKKWLVAYQDLVIKGGGKLLHKDEIQSYCEQVVFRAYLCAPCMEAGACVDCKCPMPDAIHTPDNFCSQGNWNEMLAPEQWEAYKKANNLKIKITF
jgi:hypothetical protein